MNLRKENEAQELMEKMKITSDYFVINQTKDKNIKNCQLFLKMSQKFLNISPKNSIF